MMKKKISFTRKQLAKNFIAGCLIFAFAISALAQNNSGQAVRADAAKPAEMQMTSDEEVAIQAQISSVYQTFYKGYRFGAGDVMSIYIEKHKEDSIEKTAVTPLGQVFHPLLGNVNVAGKTIDQLQEYLTVAISEYIRDPKVTVTLLESNSAKYGVLGDVRDPGVKILMRPMRIFDAITQAGGITDLGNKSNVTVLRQDDFGNVQTLKVNVKKIMAGKASPEENIYLQRGDTIIVNGNTFKTISKYSSLVGLTGFVSFLFRGGR
ncbi:MAG: polysaccharide biosynthesis/export family protein [Acidobacteriota bacterium]